jgi:release factor glutamine methyltransferase
VFFADHAFDVPVDVYEPAEDSFLFAENMEVARGDMVIDVGAGCGILGIIAAEKAAKVYAVDVNPHAVHCARENAKLNRVDDKMFFVEGDLLGPVKQAHKFDLVIFNAPYLPSSSEDGSWLSFAWCGGITGRQVIDRFILEAPEHLDQNGQILLMQSSLSGITETLKKFAKKGLETCVVASRSLPFFERILLIRAREPHI